MNCLRCGGRGCFFCLPDDRPDEIMNIPVFNLQAETPTD